MKEEILDIFDISYEGSGVGKAGNKIVFVPKSLIGEKVLVEVEREHGSFAQAKIKTILVSSEKREKPFCPYFDKCGGCSFQHCNYEEEKKLKTEILSRELKKVNFDGQIQFEESPKRKDYRNKAKFEIMSDEIGYTKPKSNVFFAVESCPIACEKINETLPLIKQFLKSNEFKNLKSVYIKVLDNKVAVCFLFEKNANFERKKLKNLDIFDGFSVYFAFGDILESDKTKIYNVLGPEKFVVSFGAFEATFDISAFNQINDDVASKMYNFLTGYVKGKRVVNAYSGQGVLSMFFAQNAKFVYGIEYQRKSHESAELLCDQLDGYQLENVCGKVEDCLPSILLRDNIDLIVLDPSREGCQKVVLETILKENIAEMIYVSCNFATLVRDLKMLLSDYEIRQVKIFDMFPCTAKIETVVVLKRR